MAEIIDNKKLLLAIDAVTLGSLIFGGGIVYNKVENLSYQVSQIQTRAEASSPAVAERLARLETEVSMTREDLAEIKQILRERR